MDNIQTVDYSSAVTILTTW